MIARRIVSIRPLVPCLILIAVLPAAGCQTPGSPGVDRREFAADVPRRALPQHVAKYPLPASNSSAVAVRDAKPPAAVRESNAADKPATEVARAQTKDAGSLRALLVGHEEPDGSDKRNQPDVLPASATTLPPAAQRESPVRAIDLSTSLALAAGENPQIGFVQHRVQEAVAKLDAADALWLPSIRLGANYNKHEGSFQDVAGEVFNVSRGSIYTGFGSRAVGAGSPAVPGVYANFHLADAVFQPLIAQRTLQSRQYKVASTQNDVMLEAALAHLDLVRAVEAKRVAEEMLSELKQFADLTESFAERGQGTQADADRARTELNLQQNAVTRAEEDVRTTSARLAEVLSLDDGMRLAPAIPMIVPVTLVPADAEPEALVSQAAANRPELSENLMEIDAATKRYQKERYSPYVPHLGAGLSGGAFGGGVGSNIRHYRDRLDVDAWAYWEVRNLGFGERAARDAARSRIYQQQFRRTELTNRVRREVTEAHARAVSAGKQLAQTSETVKAAEESYRKNLQRIRNVQGLPLEVLQSIQALNAAKRERLNAKAAYNRAQFELHRALGWPIPQQPTSGY